MCDRPCVTSRVCRPCVLAAMLTSVGSPFTQEEVVDALQGNCPGLVSARHWCVWGLWVLWTKAMVRMD
jgi:hypothetical protein